MNICIFSGTFNPIHIAHLKVAEFALEHYNFDKIIFIPAYLPPHKCINKELAEHRFKMVELAVENNPRFEVSDIEYKSEGKSYSLITVKKIKELYNIKDKVNFLIGTDAFLNLKSWYKIDELKLLTHFIVFPRCDKINKDDFLYYEQNGFDFELTDMPYLNISSTEIRNHSANSIPKVEEYIKKNGLYVN